MSYAQSIAMHLTAVVARLFYASSSAFEVFPTLRQQVTGWLVAYLCEP